MGKLMSAALFVSLACGPATAQGQAIYVTCSHPSHPRDADGQWARVRGPFYRIADCDAARVLHTDLHGNATNFTTQCDY